MRPVSSVRTALALAGLSLAACAAGDGPAPGAVGTAPAVAPAPTPAREAVAVVSAAPETLPATLDSLFRGLEARIDGVLGVAAVHFESGRRLEWNGDEPFPMASVVKLPIALAVLERVDRGGIGLGDTLRVEPADVRPGRNLLGPGPVRVDRLLELMLEESDNTAADLLMATIGGPAAVRERLAELGVTGVDVSRTEGRMLSDWAGLPPPPAGLEWSPAEFLDHVRTSPPEALEAAEIAWTADPRDAATPAGMADLLAAVHQGAGLTRESLERLIGHMRDSYGEKRIPGLLPPGTPAARKSGTVGSTTNDVGIVTLPDGSHLALAVFVKSAGEPVPAREAAIAEAARALYDLFAPPSAAVPAPEIVPPPTTRSPS